MANAWIRGNLQVIAHEKSVTIKVLGGKNSVKIGQDSMLQLSNWLSREAWQMSGKEVYDSSSGMKLDEVVDRLIEIRPNNISGVQDG